MIYAKPNDTGKCPILVIAIPVTDINGMAIRIAFRQAKCAAYKKSGFLRRYCDRGSE